jgi:hypothetical protein
MIHLPNDTPDIVKIDGICYQRVGTEKGIVTAGKVPVGDFANCEECKQGSSSLFVPMQESSSSLFTCPTLPATPPTASEPIMWLTTKHGCTVYKDLGITRVEEEDDLVRRIYDNDGTNRYLSQDTEANRALWKPGDSYSALFDGSNDHMALVNRPSEYAESMDLHTFLVFKLNSTSISDYIWWSLDTTGSPSNTGGWAFLALSTGAWRHMAFDTNFTGPSTGVLREVDFGTTDTDWHIMENRFDGTDWRVFFDGTEVWNDTANGSCDMVISSPIYVAQSNQAPTADGNISFGEILQYDAALSGSEAAAIRSYLNGEWP